LIENDRIICYNEFVGYPNSGGDVQILVKLTMISICFANVQNNPLNTFDGIRKNKRESKIDLYKKQGGDF